MVFSFTTRDVLLKFVDFAVYQKSTVRGGNDLRNEMILAL